MGISESKFQFNLHFHPLVRINDCSENTLNTDQGVLRFNTNPYEIKEYDYAETFNCTKTASKVVSLFRKSNQVEILF